MSRRRRRSDDDDDDCLEPFPVLRPTRRGRSRLLRLTIGFEQVFFRKRHGNIIINYAAAVGRRRRYYYYCYSYYSYYTRSVSFRYSLFLCRPYINNNIIYYASAIGHRLFFCLPDHSDNPARPFLGPRHSLFR